MIDISTSKAGNDVLNQTNTATVFMATVMRLLQDGVENIWAAPSPTISSLLPSLNSQDYHTCKTFACGTVQPPYRKSHSNFG